MYTTTPPSQPSTRSSVLRLIGIPLLAIAVIGTGYVVYARYIKDSSTQSTKDTSPTSYSEAVKSGTEDPVDMPVISLTLSIKAGDSADISIADIKSYANGAPKKTGLISGDFEVSIVQGNKQVYSDYFNQPEKIKSETVDPETGEFINAEEITQEKLTLILPRFEGASTLYIKDRKGNQIIKRTLTDVPVIKNDPDYIIYQ